MLYIPDDVVIQKLLRQQAADAVSRLRCATGGPVLGEQRGASAQLERIKPGQVEVQRLAQRGKSHRHLNLRDSVGG